MFCPKCGQSQVSDELRFCSRCGLPLGGVAELLANNGMLPARLAAPTEARTLMSPRRRGLRQGGALLLIGMFLIPMFVVLHEIIRLPAEWAFLGLPVAVAGLLRLLYALIFADKTPAAHASAPSLYAQPTAQAQFDSRIHAGALPYGDLRPAQGLFTRRADTTEFMPPTGVTDHTTRLLADADDSAER
jgi:hypothetical protein